MITTIRLVNPSIPSYNSFLCGGGEISSLSDFQVYNTVMFTTVITVYVESPCYTGKFALFDHCCPISSTTSNHPPLAPAAPGTHESMIRRLFKLFLQGRIPNLPFVCLAFLIFPCMDLYLFMLCIAFLSSHPKGNTNLWNQDSHVPASRFLMEYKICLKYK